LRFVEPSSDTGSYSFPHDQHDRRDEHERAGRAGTVTQVTANPTSLAWDRLDERHSLASRLASNEVIYLDADEIRNVGAREPRLMTKFDTRACRPSLLRQTTILPVSNGGYVLLPGDGYADVSDAQVHRRWRLPDSVASLRTLPWSSGPTSESQALDMALTSGLLGDFLEDQQARLTVRGRLRSPKFDFGFRCRHGNVRVNVDGVQIEVDSGLEGDRIHLVEAKLGSRGDFHVRQLYYPLRMWMMRVPGKAVTTSLLTWSNRVFSLRRYEFDPGDAYHGLRLVAGVDYVIDEERREERRALSLRDILGAVPERRPLPKPFPQADDMAKVIDVVDAVGAGCEDANSIQERYDFVGRQADYYGNAGVFLDLLARKKGGFILSASGPRFRTSTIEERTAMIAASLASLPVFRDALEHLDTSGHPPTIGTVAMWIEQQTELTGDTPVRRAKTVISWTQWIANALSRRAR
jgi:hypothetical protein